MVLRSNRSFADMAQGDWSSAGVAAGSRSDNTVRGSCHPHEPASGPREKRSVLGVHGDGPTGGALEAERSGEEPPHDGKRTDLPCDREGAGATRARQFPVSNPGPAPRLPPIELQRERSSSPSRYSPTVRRGGGRRA